MKANRKLLRFCYVCADYSERLIEGKQRTWARKADDNPKMKPNIIFRVKLLGILETNAPVDFRDKKKSYWEFDRNFWRGIRGNWGQSFWGLSEISLKSLCMRTCACAYTHTCHCHRRQQRKLLYILLWILHI